jgi:hypothetical protein
MYIIYIMFSFGYTNPDILKRRPEETPSDGTHMYNGSFFKRMENFKTIKEISGEYPRVDIQDLLQVILDKFNDFTINSIAANYKPQSGLFSNFYNGLSNDEKHYSYAQQVFYSSVLPATFC